MPGDLNLRRILAFDCSGASCSAAVVENGIVRAERFQRMERGQAETLLPQIREVMAEAGLGFSELDAIATPVGPGSFAGLRIGLAAARGLALAADLPILAPTSFACHWAGLPADLRAGRVAVAIDSRRGPVFAQIFGSSGNPEGEPASVAVEDFAAWLGPAPALVTGDAGALLTGQRLAPEDRIRPLAVALAGLALPGPTASPSPLYLRDPDVTQPKAGR